MSTPNQGSNGPGSQPWGQSQWNQPPADQQAPAGPQGPADPYGQAGSQNPYGQYGSQPAPGQYGSQPGQFGSQPPAPDQYGSQPGQFGSQPGQFGSQPAGGQYGSQPGQFGSQPPAPGQYGSQPAPGQYGSQPAAYGSAAGEFVQNSPSQPGPESFGSGQPGGSVPGDAQAGPGQPLTGQPAPGQPGPGQPGPGQPGPQGFAPIQGGPGAAPKPKRPGMLFGPFSVRDLLLWIGTLFSLLALFFPVVRFAVSPTYSSGFAVSSWVWHWTPFALAWLILGILPVIIAGVLSLLNKAATGFPRRFGSLGNDQLIAVLTAVAFALNFVYLITLVKYFSVGGYFAFFGALIAFFAGVFTMIPFMAEEFRARTDAPAHPKARAFTASAPVAQQPLSSAVPQPGTYGQDAQAAAPGAWAPVQGSAAPAPGLSVPGPGAEVPAPGPGAPAPDAAAPNAAAPAQDQALPGGVGEHPAPGQDASAFAQNEPVGGPAPDSGPASAAQPSPFGEFGAPAASGHDAAAGQFGQDAAAGQFGQPEATPEPSAHPANEQPGGHADASAPFGQPPVPNQPTAPEPANGYDASASETPGAMSNTAEPTAVDEQPAVQQPIDTSAAPDAGFTDSSSAPSAGWATDSADAPGTDQAESAVGSEEPAGGMSGDGETAADRPSTPEIFASGVDAPVVHEPESQDATAVYPPVGDPANQSPQNAAGSAAESNQPVEGGNGQDESAIGAQASGDQTADARPEGEVPADGSVGASVTEPEEPTQYFQAFDYSTGGFTPRGDQLEPNGGVQSEHRVADEQPAQGQDGSGQPESTWQGSIPQDQAQPASAQFQGEPQPEPEPQQSSAPVSYQNAFWFAVPEPRVAVDPQSNVPVFTVTPGEWFLAIADYGNYFLVQDGSGRQAILPDVTGVQRA